MSSAISLQMLGQSGCRVAFPGLTVYADPYLSHSVQALDAPDLRRQTPIAFDPESVTDADWMLITHEHIDHCDPHTLPKLARSSPQCRFVGPKVVLDLLRSWGIDDSRLVVAETRWIDLGKGVTVHAVPAAHPDLDRDEAGRFRYVGYVLQHEGKRIYVAGDTKVCEELLTSLKALAPIDTALLPVNEHNFFRGRRGIIGNMSIRDAFGLASEIGIRRVIPVHWDMFAVNSVYPEEIEVVYRKSKPNFELRMAKCPETVLL